MKKVLALAAFAVLGGCMSTGEIVPTGKDSFMIGSIGRGTYNHTEVKAASLKRANEFCASRNQAMVVDHLSANGVTGWTPVESELMFYCVDKNDPVANQRPQFTKEANTVIEVRK